MGGASPNQRRRRSGKAGMTRTPGALQNVFDDFIAAAEHRSAKTRRRQSSISAAATAAGWSARPTQRWMFGAALLAGARTCCVRRSRSGWQMAATGAGRFRDAKLTRRSTTSRRRPIRRRSSTSDRRSRGATRTASLKRLRRRRWPGAGADPHRDQGRPRGQARRARSSTSAPTSCVRQVLDMAWKIDDCGPPVGIVGR